MTDKLTGINGAEVTPEQRARWRKERQDQLREKQRAAGNPLLEAWNAAFDRPKSHRRKK